MPKNVTIDKEVITVDDNYFVIFKMLEQITNILNKIYREK